MRILSIDIETYSPVDLGKSGVYAYTEGEGFEILLLGYAFDDEEVRVIDLKNSESLPRELERALTDPSIIKTAFNANFERVCLESHFNIKMAPEQWSCTAVKALTLGLPASLEGVSRCLNLKEQKLSEGKELIKYFSLPCRSSSANGFRTRNLPCHDGNKWNTFSSYCLRDVEVERNIRKVLDKHELTDVEKRLWHLDQKINDGGVKVDRELLRQALLLNSQYENSLKDEAAALTGIENPKSPAQLKKWLLEAEGMEVDSLSKERVEALLEEVSTPEAKRALELRKELSKTSIKKYETIERGLCRDDRIRGLLKFYGANRTGRWASRLVHTLPQNKIKDLSLARELLKKGEFSLLELLFESIPEVLSQLVRTAFIPSEGCRFIISDYNSIEARVLAWLASEKWRLNVFNSHGRIYEASASQMFKVPIEEITKESPLRQKGKIAELALGYQGGKGALMAMGGIKLGLAEEELQSVVSAWRDSNPNITKLWKDVERAAVTAVIDRTFVRIQRGIGFFVRNDKLFIKLPSGRTLSYISPRIGFGRIVTRPQVTYEGMDQNTKQWGRINTYGGKLVENIVQAIARDCLAEAMLRLDNRGYKIALHVHDEVVLDVPYGFGSVREVENIMAEPIPWAKGLPLRAEGFESEVYRK
jgi:DNA polymerase bacteriophage-type